jgi:hypothetical protein
MRIQRHSSVSSEGACSRGNVRIVTEAAWS